MGHLRGSWWGLSGSACTPCWAVTDSQGSAQPQGAASQPRGPQAASRLGLWGEGAGGHGSVSCHCWGAPMLERVRRLWPGTDPVVGDRPGLGQTKAPLAPWWFRGGVSSGLVLPAGPLLGGRRGKLSIMPWLEVSPPPWDLQYTTLLCPRFQRTGEISPTRTRPVSYLQSWDWEQPLAEKGNKISSQTGDKSQGEKLKGNITNGK